MRHSWHRIHKFLFVCRNCGTLRAKYIINRKERFIYHSRDLHHLLGTPQCTGEWPEKWQPEYQAAVAKAAELRRRSQ